MISCKEASRLTSEKFDRKLSISEWTALRMHMALCAGCSCVDQQLQLLRQAMRRYVDRPNDKNDTENS